jgi:hypothetical protein
MKRLVFVGLIWLAAGSLAYALSNYFYVTPKSLDQDEFEFAVTSSPTNSGVVFTVTIMPKPEAVLPEREGYLCFAKLTGDSQSVGPFNAKTQIVLKKTNQVLTASFVAPPELMQNPEACFVFRVRAKAPEGRLTIRPANYYILKLRDFLK